MKLMEWLSSQKFQKYLKRLFNRNKDIHQINIQNLTIYIKMHKEDKRDKISFIARVLRLNVLSSPILKRLSFIMLKHFLWGVLSKLIKYFKNWAIEWQAVKIDLECV